MVAPIVRPNRSEQVTGGFWAQLCDRLAYRVGRTTHWWRLIRRVAARASGTWALPRRARCRGSVFELDLQDAHQRSIYYLGVHELRETRFLERTVKPGWVVCDVGANMGYFSLLLSHLAVGGTVFAFEPTTRMFETLKRNIGLNAAGNVRPQRVALGESSGTVQLVETAGESLSCTRVARQGETGSEDVTVTTLDAFVAENGIPRLDLIKIDIEGSEARFLRGAANSLRRWHPVLLIEINPAVLEQFGSTAAEVASLLSDLGYQLYRSSLTGLRPLRELPIAPQYVNGVAIAASDPSS